MNHHRDKTTSAKAKLRTNILGLWEDAEPANGLTSPPKALGFAVEDGEVPVVVDEGDIGVLAPLIDVGELVVCNADDTLVVAAADDTDDSDVVELAAADEVAEAAAVEALAFEALEAVEPPVVSEICGHSAPRPPPWKMVPISVDESASMPLHCWLTRLATCWTPAAQAAEHGLLLSKSREVQSGMVERYARVHDSGKPEMLCQSQKESAEAHELKHRMSDASRVTRTRLRSRMLTDLEMGWKAGPRWLLCDCNDETINRQRIRSNNIVLEAELRQRRKERVSGGFEGRGRDYGRKAVVRRTVSKWSAAQP